METVGSYLKQQRERAGVALENVATATKIRASLLQDLESDRLDRLPGGVFARGFVRAYADAIRVRPDRALELLDGQTTGTADVDPTYASPLAAEAEGPSGRFRVAHLLVLLVALLTMLGAYFMIAGPGQERNSVSSAQTTDVDSGTTRSFTPRNENRH
jgi:cytoskeleton protein RodZ